MKQFYSTNPVKASFILPRRVMMMLLTFAGLSVFGTVALGQTVTTNKVDYKPGDVVMVSGKGWQPFENVSLVMKELNFNNPGKTSTIQCNGIGQFSTPFYTVVNADLGAFFHITATGQTSKHVATITFNDAGGSYAIDFSAYDPKIYNKRLPGQVTIPVGFSADGPLGNTYHSQTVEALTPSFLGLGQIVAFEFFIRVDAVSGCPNDAITFTAQFDTKTGKNGSNFGYDPDYGIYAAFVDREPGGGNIDPLNNATVTNIGAPVLGDYFFTGDVTVSGLDPGDEITVEVWVVLKNTIPAGANGNVAAALKDAVTAGTGAGTCAPGDKVNTGNQTINLNQVGEFFTTDVDLNITKTDSQDPVTIGTPFTYTLTITNSGPSVANNVVITDVLSSSNLVVGTITYSNGDANWTSNLVGQTLTLSTLSIGIGETITITIPVTWTGVYSGTQTGGSAGTGGYGSTCTGDLTNKVSVTTISDDTNLANNSYCQPTNVYCATVNVNAGPDKELTCTITQVTLEGSSTTTGATFSWAASGGGHIVSGALTATPTVDAAGTYTLTVTDPVSGCTGTDVALVTLNNTPPNVNAGPDKELTCTITQVTLEGSSTTTGATFSWAASGGGHIVSGALTATPTVDAAGTYTLTVTDPANGCTATDVAVVTLNSTLPNVNAGPDKELTCTITQVTLEGSSTTTGATFSWAASGGGHIVSGALTATPTVDAAGTYTLTVTDPANGCTATDVAVVTLNSTLPNVNAGPDKELTCTITQVTLEGSSTTTGATFSWAASGGGHIVSGALTATPMVDAAGTYTLTVTDPANGCTATDVAVVTLNSTLPNVNAGPDKELTCTITQVTLEGSSTTTGATFSWAASGGGHIVSGALTATPTVDAAGTYTLTVTDPANGCTATDVAVVTLNSTLPNVNAGPDKELTCTITQVTLEGSSTTTGATFSWAASGGGHIVSGALTATPTVDAAGTYTLTVTDPANGCTATDVAVVTLNSTLPNVNAGPDKELTCTITQVTLEGSSTTTGATFSWAASGGGHIVSGALTATPTVDAAGTYTLTVTDPANGCTATDVAVVTLNSTLPNVNAGPDKELTCTITQVTLEGSSTTTGATFSWAASGGGHIVSGALTATPTVDAAGTYTLTVTDPANGCTATDVAVVTLNSTPPNANAGPDKQLICNVTQVTLEGSSTTTGATFSWAASGGGHIVSGALTATPLVDAAGTYTLTVTDPTNGCTATDIALVTMAKDTEPPVITCPAPITVECAYLVPKPVLPEATDNCGIKEVKWIGDVKSSQTCPDNFIITRTYQATDNSGNTTTCTQIITVFNNVPLDPIPPTFSKVACVKDIWDGILPPLPVVKDHCGNVLTPTGPVKSNLPTCEGSKTWTWTYTDCAGNKQQYVHTVTVEMPPLAPIEPTYSTVECVNQIWDGILPKLPVVTDGCGNVLVPTGPVKTNLPKCTGTKTWTWTYTDCAGHTQQYVHTVEVKMPVFKEIKPTSATFDCVKDIKMPILPLVKDYCGNILSPTGPVITMLDDCQGSRKYTWTYTDCAGNKRDYVHTVTILPPKPFGPIAPTFSTVACVKDIGDHLLPPLPVVKDACGNILSPTGPVKSALPECEGSKTWTWTYTDCAGNSQNYVHTVTVEMEPFGEIAPTSAIFACEKDIVLPVLPVVRDNCGNVLTPTGPVSIPMEGCKGSQKFVWTYKDCEGNSREYIHTVTIKPPVFDAITPTFATVSCPDEVTEPVPPVVKDYCGNIIVPVGPVKSALPSCEGTKTFTWTYTDCAGNKRDYVHTVTVDYKPFPPIPSTSATVDDAMDIVMPVLPVVKDNCGNILDPSGPVVSPMPECEGDVTYTWTYTDCAGNSQDYVHIITIKGCVALNHCTYTQGFYGNVKGKNCFFNGDTYVSGDALAMMKAAFGDKAFVMFGTETNGKYFKLMKESLTTNTTPEGIFQMLPGGGTPDALVGAATSLDEMAKWGNVPRSVQAGSLGKIRNNLLSQTITLFFNLGNDKALGDIRLRGPYMITEKSSECGSLVPVPNSGLYTEIPQSVLDYFAANHLEGTIKDLYDLANMVLGGEIISPAVSAGDVTSAVDAINVGFDECRILVKFTSTKPDVPKAATTTYEIGKRITSGMSGEAPEVILTVYPNPFRTTVRFQLDMVADSKVKVEVYSQNGQLLKIIFNEELRQGDVRTTEFDASMYAHSAFLYKVVTNNGIKSGTVMKIR